eukprot:Nitzschia sp. Nitz4//scaffold50_size126154//107061//109970//NITZ4_003702-RA/size126154-processed-gene-0.64-mRNA-1//-1//CDS//3329553749//6731//frame0
MGKRPRTPHFIAGIGDGNVHLNVPDEDNEGHAGDESFLLEDNARDTNALPRLRAGRPNRNTANSYGTLSRNARNERLARLEQPLLASEQWRDVLNGDPTLGKRSDSVAGPWQMSAFALLALVVVMSAIFLHAVAEQNQERGHSSYGSYKRRQRHARRMYKTRKKKTDEWSDDEDDWVFRDDDRSASPGQSNSPVAEQYPYMQQFYAQGTTPPRVQAFASSQEHRHRRSGNKEPNTPPHVAGVHSNYYMPVNNTYKSPAANLRAMTGVHRRGISPRNSFNSQKSYASSGVAPSPSGTRATAPLSGRLRVPQPPDARDIFPSLTPNPPSFHANPSLLPTPPEESQLDDGIVPAELPLSQRRRSSSINSHNVPSQHSDLPPFPSDSSSVPLSQRSQHSMTLSEAALPPGQSMSLDTQGSRRSSHFRTSHQDLMYSSHRQNLELSPGNYEASTPQVGNRTRRTMHDLPPGGVSPMGFPSATGVQSFDSRGVPFPSGGQDAHSPIIPFIPTLDTSHRVSAGDQNDRSPLIYMSMAPPRSVNLEDMKLFQMETGSSIHWAVKDHESERGAGGETDVSLYDDDDIRDFDDYVESESDNDGSDISIPSGDPRKRIIHERANLTMSTDSYSALQAGIQFEELELQEVIGGGGFGQVWKASWRGTPVAVKVLTGAAQNKHIAKAILEEFRAEINLLKGMRHPNICLYMGACVQPPNRAIVTELAANGSVWDALRLPLSPPYSPADGTALGAWPASLYTPSEHGVPPGGKPQTTVPIPPKGSWPWMLVKRVACGAARGMAYLHSGNPPVLHRDLKSANLLLDESYTAKVCDFGLSRLKAQARSMTGNCGTVQWMAPEVLANKKYDEKADVFSYGIILWELLSRECPYEGMTAIQCALAVLNRDKRPEIPKWCPPQFHALIRSCTKKDQSQRPTFSEIIVILDAMPSS